jgi:hypothetical protein
MPTREQILSAWRTRRCIAAVPHNNQGEPPRHHLPYQGHKKNYIQKPESQLSLAEGVEHMPRNCEALSLNPNSIKNGESLLNIEMQPRFEPNLVLSQGYLRCHQPLVSPPTHDVKLPPLTGSNQTRTISPGVTVRFLSFSRTLPL